MLMQSLRSAVAAGGAALACASMFMSPEASAQPVTASLWSELGAGSASGTGIGSEFSLQGVAQTAVDPATGNVYVAWGAPGGEIFVRRWNGSAWSDVGAGSSSGGGVSQSPSLTSDYPRLVVRGTDGNVFLIWRESLVAGSSGDVYAAQFNGQQWLRLGPAGGRISSSAKVWDYPDIILSQIFSTAPMPIVAWTDDFALYVKRWTGISWVEMGTGSASSYPIPDFPPAPGQPPRPPITAFGINADDQAQYRYYPATDTLEQPDNWHVSSDCPRLMLDPFGKPAVVFLNGRYRNGSIQYPYGLHVRRFLGDNSARADSAWQDLGRISSPTGDQASDSKLVECGFSVAGLAAGFGLTVAGDMTDLAPEPAVVALSVLRFTGNSWVTLPALPDNQGPDPFQPSVALKPDGNLVVAWHTPTQGGSNYEIYVRQSANVGGLFGWAELGAGSGSGGGVSNNAGISTWASLALDTRSSNTVATVVWSDGNGQTLDNPVFVRQAPQVAAAPPVLSLSSVAGAEGNSGASTLDFTVSVDQPAGAAGVTFNMATAASRGAGNSALAGSDYAAAGPLPMTIPFGQTSAIFSVKILGDRQLETDEVFQVRVTGLIGATLGNGIAIGTIINDDTRPPNSATPGIGK